jgi:hypothetical protein
MAMKNTAEDEGARMKRHNVNLKKPTERENVRESL